MKDIPKEIIADFKKVRDKSGVSISRQMKMYEDGYRIVGSTELPPNEKLVCKKFDTLEYSGHDEYSFVGNIIMKDGKFCSAEIVDNVFFDEQGIGIIRAFIDEAERIIEEDIEE